MKFKLSCLIIILSCSYVFTKCVHSNATSNQKTETKTEHDIVLKPKELIENLFDTILSDGFSFPFGDGSGVGQYVSLSDNKKYDGWYIATKTGEKYELGIHTGEDWNGNGGGNSDLGQPVYSTAKGKVLNAKDYGAPWGNVVYIEHRYIENAKLKIVYSLYAHLNEIFVKEGSVVLKREKIGTIGTGHNTFAAHLHFEIRKEKMKKFEVTYWPSSNNKDEAWVLDNYYKPTDFIKEHKKIVIPAKTDSLLIVLKHDYKLYLYVKGIKTKEYDVALSQSPVGHKEKEGDNKMPEGAYYITEKNKGPFYGTYKDFFGPAWLRISYPNNFDAELGFEKKLISKKNYDAIVLANKKRMQPPKNTGIGGGIGIHGWAGNWPQNNRALTWGCVSMKNKDLEGFYELVSINTNLYILP